MTLSNGQSWTGGPTFNLVKGANILRNLSVAGALTATFQNLDDTILIESDSYARSETYTQLETGTAIIAAALDAPVPDGGPGAGARCPTEVSSYVAGPDQQPGELGHLLGPQLLRQQQPGRLQDHNGPAGLLHAGRTDQAIADAVTGGVDLSPYFTSAETQTYVANELLSFFPRAELDSLLTATLTQYTGRRAHPNRDRRRHRRGTKRPGTPATSCALPARSQGKSSTWSRSSSRPAS